MKKIYLLTLTLGCSLLATTALKAQVKVGDNPTTINANSALEVESTDKGVLIPRLNLTGTANAAPLAAHVAGMLVYNLATAGDVTPGFYYNNGTKWVQVGANQGPHEWNDSTGYIIAADALTNGDTVVVTDDGRIGVNTTTPSESLQINGSLKTLTEVSPGNYGGFYSGSNGLGLGFPTTAMLSIPNSTFNPATDDIAYVNLLNKQVRIGTVQDIIASTGYSSTINVDPGRLWLGYQKISAGNDSVTYLDFDSQSIVLGYRIGSATNNKYRNYVADSDQIYIGHSDDDAGAGTIHHSFLNLKSPSSSFSEVVLQTDDQGTGFRAGMEMNTELQNPGDPILNIFAQDRLAGNLLDGSGIEMRPEEGITFSHYSTTNTVGSYTFPTNKGLANQVLTDDGTGQLKWGYGEGLKEWSDSTGYIIAADALTNGDTVVVTDDGRIGIGVLNPSETFHLKGTLKQEYTNGLGDVYQNFIGNNFPLLPPGTDAIVTAYGDASLAAGTGGHFAGTFTYLDNIASLVTRNLGGGPTNSRVYSAINTPDADPQYFLTVENEILGHTARIFLDGNTGIGTPDPNLSLLVNDQLNSNSAEIRMTTANGIRFSSNVAGVYDEYFFPKADGTANHVLTTDGAGQLYWDSGAGLSEWSDSTGYIIAADALTNGHTVVVTDDGDMGIGTATPVARIELVTETSDSKDDNIEITTYNNTIGGARLSGRRAYGTRATPSFLPSGVMMMEVNGRPWAGTDFVQGNQGAGMQIRSAEAHSATALGSYIAFKTTDLGALVATIKMTISADGDVGIGTTAPTEKLDIAGAVKIGDGGYAGITDGAVTPVPTGGAGTMVFLNGHFYGWTGTSWKQLDN